MAVCSHSPLALSPKSAMRGLRIETFATPDRLEFVRVVNYGLNGVIGDAETVARS